MNLVVKLSLLLVLLFPLSSVAELPKQMEDDFAAVSGYIIMPIGDEFLVDLDASSNLHEGDILTLIVPGEKVIHPITKEILGTLDIPKGFLQVTRIKSGYSYAKLLATEEKPEKGDQVRRFEQVPTRYLDRQGDGQPLGEQLRAGLPQLKWLQNNSSQEPLLIFTLEKQNLSVTTAANNVLRSYVVRDGQPVATSAPLQQLATELPEKQKKPLQKAVNSLLDAIVPGGSQRDPTAGTELGIIRQDQQSRAGIWMSPSLRGEPTGIAVTDLDNDGQNEIVVAMLSSIHIAKNLQGEYKPVADLDLPTGLTLLSLDSLDLDNNGLPELYITASREGELQSLVIEYTGGSLQTTIREIGWYLRVAEMADKGLVLLGQRKGQGEKHFEGKPFQVQRQADQLVAGEEISLPDYVNIFSFVSFKDADNQMLYAYLTETDYLKVARPSGEVLWESGDYFGGTEIFLTPKGYGGNELDQLIYIRPRLMLNSAGEILVTQNDGLRTLQRFRRFKESRLIALTWNGHSLVENWRTSDQNGYLNDFTLADADNDGADEIVMAIKFKHKGMIQKARSAIVSYELN